MTEINPKQELSEEDKYWAMTFRVLLINKETQTKAELAENLKQSLEYYQQKREYLKQLTTYCDDIIEFLSPLVKDD